MDSLLSRRPVGSFVVLAVLFSWVVWTVGSTVLTDPLPAILLGAWGPTLAAVLVTARLDGCPAVRSLLARLDPRIGGRWSLLAVGLPFLAAGFALVVFLAVGGVYTPELPGGLPPVALPVVLLVNVLIGGALAEEAGWRGFALPRLRSRYGTAPAGAVVGVVWALWHLPLFVLPGTGLAVAGFPLGWFLPIVVGYSLLLAWLADRTDDALAPAVLFHGATNTAAGSLALVPVAEQLALWAYVLFLWGLAAALFVLAGLGSPPVMTDRIGS